MSTSSISIRVARESEKFPQDNQLDLLIGTANFDGDNDLILPAFDSGLSGGSAKHLNHRVKRNRIKVRYNRNKDIVRDYG